MSFINFARQRAATLLRQQGESISDDDFCELTRYAGMTGITFDTNDGAKTLGLDKFLAATPPEYKRSFLQICNGLMVKELWPENVEHIHNTINKLKMREVKQSYIDDCCGPASIGYEEEIGYGLDSADERTA